MWISFSWINGLNFFVCFIEYVDRKVTGAWGYYILGDSLRITSSGPEYSPMINFPISSGAWYNLKSEVNGSQVRIYVNDKLVKEITMLGSGADARSDNYVGLWCHSRISIKGDSFQVQGNVTFLCYDMMTSNIDFAPWASHSTQ